MPLPRIVVFQYNPEQVTRALRPRGEPVEQHAPPADAHRIWGAPVETISMTVHVDASDQLASSDTVAATLGIGPALAALEMLLYPSTVQVIANTALLAAGTIEIMPPQAPLTVLAWGPSRVVPIRVEGLSITEEAFDQALNPTRAAVELSARLLTYSDLQIADAGYALFLAHQVFKESMAVLAGAAAVGSVAARVGT